MEKEPVFGSFSLVENLFLLVDALADLRCLAASVAEVEELRSADHAVTDDLDAADARAVIREGAE